LLHFFPFWDDDYGMKNQKTKARTVLFIGVVAVVIVIDFATARAAYHFASFRGRPPIHIHTTGSASPSGLTPNQVKAAYHLPLAGGKGTIAIIDAYDNATVEGDLNVFSAAFKLPMCDRKNPCFEKHKMASSVKTDSGWAFESALDVEWAHAIAPQAKILLIEAATPSGANLLAAIDYAASRKDVVAVSMSWGGAEFPEEASLDGHFISKTGAVFFASSGDNGAGVSWPAASPNVVGVGGTTLAFSAAGDFLSETAWSGSGGGVSGYEPEPDWQASYRIPRAKSKRAVPDVSYNADTASGFPVYKTSGTSKKNWYVVGGTSAGAPQWAAIHALGGSVSLAKLYTAKASADSLKYFRDVTSGSNGDCAYYCDARKHYDYVTGLGSPLTVKF
jgi:subtilase family serine protease